jgi:sugar (pentulose or hexulose) kinase
VAQKYVLAIDAGSGSCRALVFDIRGPVVSSAYRKWTYNVPAENAPLGKQFDPPGLWESICRLVREAVQKADVPPSDIVAVSTASQRNGVVFLGKDGKELYGGPNTDLRALMEGLAIDAEHGSRLHRITGHAPAFLFSPAKLRWFRDKCPAVYGQIATVLTINNWIIYRLSGRRVAEPSSDSDTGLVDVGGSCWSAELQEMLGVPPGVCPEMTVAGTRVGSVSATVAEQTGLDPGTLVVVGGADTQCGLLGMGVKDEGHVGIVAGWSAPIQMVTDKPILDPTGKIWSSCHILPRKWVLESNAAECGGAYSWLNELFYDGSNAGGDTYGLMDVLAGEAPAGSEGALAFIGPRAMDMTRLKPLMGGVFFPITPSVTQVERKHIVRAALEGTCFAFKSNCVQLEETSQLKMRSVSIGGGLARSRILSQILADVLAMPVNRFETAEVTSCGAAICAAVGAGVYTDLEQASEAMRPKASVISPDTRGLQDYSGYYNKWLKAVRWLDSLGEEMM